jgi:hypothetical protein
MAHLKKCIFYTKELYFKESLKHFAFLSEFGDLSPIDHLRLAKIKAEGNI